MSLTEALLKWLSSCFHLPQLIDSQSCSDGVHLAKILRIIDSNHFTQKWVSAIKVDIPSENFRLKASNLKKVLNSILEYYSEFLQIQISSKFPIPDVNRVAEASDEDTGRLLQLILGCAINCDDKQTYIESIMMLEESIQQVLMQAIQELMNWQTSNSETTLSPTEVRKLQEDFNEANREREELKQKCHDLENKVNLLEDEKTNIVTEYEQYQKKISGTSVGQLKDDKVGFLSQELKKQLDDVQEELFKSEAQKEELLVKIEFLEKQAEESQTKEAELQKLADEALKLKDEIDILRETSDKAIKMEAAIESYKKKMEEMGDLKRQVKILEDQNTNFMQRNMELEEDVKKTGSWKPQVDNYKKQITELRSKVDSETKKSDKLDFETKKLLEKVEALSVERDRLQNENLELKEKNVELNDDIKFGQVSKSNQSGLEDGDNDLGTLEMIPPNIKERLLRLQRENKQLRAANSSGSKNSGNSELLQTVIDDLRERERSLEAENRKANQKIIELESKLEENGGASVPRVPGSREELELKLAEATKKINSLQEVNQKKEIEIHAMEERYKKYIEKAKSVIKTLDPKSSGGQQAGGTMSGPELATLRNQIADKDRLIETLEQETEKARAVREMEERLLSSAFYNLSMQLHRNGVEARLSHATGNSGAAPTGQSFLARQRQVQSSSSNRGSKGYSSSDFLEY